MFKNSLKTAHNALVKNRVSLHTSAPLKEKWDLLTAVLVERKPVIASDLLEIEKEFKDYLNAVEYERSLKNDIEIRLEKEKIIATQKKDVEELDVTSKNTAQDLIDAWKEELMRFKPADQTTKADKSNNVTSLLRKLDRPLVCVVKQKVGEKDFYLLPQGKLGEGETLKECAQRVIKQKCGEEIKVQILGNAPCSFYKYKYPKPLRSDSVGAKIFIYFARYGSGQVTAKDFKWLDKKELDEMLPNPYKKSVLPVLFD